MDFRKTKNNQLLRLPEIGFAFLIFCGCVTFVGCQTKEQKLTSGLKKCQEFLDRDNVEAAGNCYQQLIKANPLEAKQISKAGEDAVFKKCLEFKDRKDFKNSIICLEGITVFKLDSANVYFLLADSYYQYNKALNYGTKDLLEKAETTIKKGLEIRPEDAAAHSLYGEILTKKGNLQGALLEHQQAVKLEPKVRVFLIDLASAQEKTNDFTAAIESYKKALDLNSNDTLVLYFLGLLYEKTGNTGKAIETLEKLFQLNSDYDKDAKEMLDSLKEKRKLDQEKNLLRQKAKSVG